MIGLPSLAAYVCLVAIACQASAINDLNAKPLKPFIFNFEASHQIHDASSLIQDFAKQAASLSAVQLRFQRASRHLKATCQNENVDGMKFCTILNGIPLTSTGVIYAKSMDIYLQNSYRSFVDSSAALNFTKANTSSCVAAYAAFICLYDLNYLHCVDGVQSYLPSCNPIYCRFLAGCGAAPLLEAQCNALNSSEPFPCSSGAQPAPPSSITIPRQGDSCSPQPVNSSAGSCAAPLAGALLTSDGLAAANALGRVAWPVVLDLGDALGYDFADKPGCRAAYAAYYCLDLVAGLRCVGGVQAAILPCPAACAAFSDACFPDSGGGSRICAGLSSAGACANATLLDTDSDTTTTTTGMPTPTFPLTPRTTPVTATSPVTAAGPSKSARAARARHAGPAHAAALALALAAAGGTRASMV
jgi:hypothetical protein